MLYIVELSRLKLKSLDFSCNKIQEIPIEYRHMESLEELVLDSNPLISPPAHVSCLIYNNDNEYIYKYNINKVILLLYYMYHLN